MSGVAPGVTKRARRVIGPIHARARWTAELPQSSVDTLATTVSKGDEGTAQWTDPSDPSRPEPSSIFSRPDPDEPTAPRTEPDQRQTTLDPLDVSTWGPPARPESSGSTAAGQGASPAGRRQIGSRHECSSASGRQVRSPSSSSASSPSRSSGLDDEPALAAGAGSPTPTASPSAEPTIAATPEPSATPEPTPEPTPAGPPVELAVGDWATVTADELKVRAGAGEDQDSTYTLIRGAVLTVAEGPQAVDGANWYRVASLGGAAGWVSSGWIANPSLETILNDPVLIRCGEVANPVFDIVDGAPVPREVAAGRRLRRPEQQAQHGHPGRHRAGPGDPRRGLRHGAGRRQRPSDSQLRAAGHGVWPRGGRWAGVLAAARG